MHRGAVVLPYLLDGLIVKVVVCLSVDETPKDATTCARQLNRLNMYSEKPRTRVCLQNSDAARSILSRNSVLHIESPMLRPGRNKLTAAYSALR